MSNDQAQPKIDPANIQQQVQILENQKKEAYNKGIDHCLEMINEDVSRQSSWDDLPQKEMIERLIRLIQTLKKPS